MDTSELEAAYRALLDVARPGGFRAPSDRQDLSAELLLAHVAADDRLLAATTASVLDGAPVAYDNGVASSVPYLEAITWAAGDWDGLVGEVRRCGLALVQLARRLGDEAATPVPTRIVEAGQVKLDAPMPWSGVLSTRAQVALPGIRERLAALR